MNFLGLTPEQHYNIFMTFLATIPAILTALASLIVAFRTGQKVDRVETQTNSMHDVIVKAERKDARDKERANPTQPDNTSPTSEDI